MECALNNLLEPMPAGNPAEGWISLRTEAERCPLELNKDNPYISQLFEVWEQEWLLSM